MNMTILRGKGKWLALIAALAAGIWLWRGAAVPQAAKPQIAVAQLSATIAAEGRVTTYPGGEVLVGTDFPGTIAELRVAEKSTVKKGDVLALIAAADIHAALAHARARVAELDTDMAPREHDLGRARELQRAGFSSRQALERAQRDVDALRAQRNTALAEVARLDAVLAKTRIIAPMAGVVTARHADAGETVEAGAPLLTLADLRRLRVEAEVDEFDSGHLQLHGAVEIRAEGYDAVWRGHVEEIPDAVTVRRTRPQDPALPTDTRVLLVKIALDEAVPLKLGQRVEVRIRHAAILR